MSILLVEPNLTAAFSIKNSLKSGKTRIEVVKNGEEALKKVKLKNYKLIISEINLEKMNGLELIKEIRKKHNELPILILTENGELETKINAFNLGADDFLMKPPSLPELYLRVNALLRRKDTALHNSNLCVGDLFVNPQTKEVIRAGIKIKLRKKEFELLEFLVKNKEIVFNRNTILEFVWDYNANAFTNTVDVHIKHLREKIDKGFKKSLIKTVHGVGYKICEN